MPHNLLLFSRSAAYRPCVPADLYRLGINAEYILRPIDGYSHILADFFCKTGRQFTPCVELYAAYKVWQILLAHMVQTMEEKIFAVEAESSGDYAQNHDFKVGKFRNYTTTWYVAGAIYTILTNSLYIPRILTKFVIKLCIGNAIVINSFSTTNSLTICTLYSF